MTKGCSDYCLHPHFFAYLRETQIGTVYLTGTQMKDWLIASHVLSFGTDETKEMNKYPFADSFVHLFEFLSIYNVKNGGLCDNRNSGNGNFG